MNEEAAHANGRVRNDKSPLVSDDPRLHQQESNEDGHHVDIKAVSQDAVTLDRVEPVSYTHLRAHETG